MEAVDSGVVCLNCRETVLLRYCPRCGQKAQSLRVPIMSLLHDVVHDLTHLDGKLAQAFLSLITKPGFLTLEFMQGRRARYVPPFRLYLVISMLLFGALSLIPTHQKISANSEKVFGVEVDQKTREKIQEKLKNGLKKEDFENQNAVFRLGYRLRMGFNKALLEPEHLVGNLKSRISNAMFVLMPAFAFLLYLVHVKPKRETYYIDHMVFSLHFHGFVFVIYLGLLGLGMLPGEGWKIPFYTILCATLPLYLVMALRKVHFQSWKKSIIKAGLVFGVYGCLMVSVIASLVVFSLARL